MTTFNKVVSHITHGDSFVLEAGAGSGKTYTLIQTLNYLLTSKGEKLNYNKQKIICITYTNVAKNEIIERLEYNPLVIVSTIHEFMWDCIKPYQAQLKKEICKLNEIRNIEEDAKKELLTPAKKERFIKKYIPNLIDRIESISNVYYNDNSFRDFEKGLLHHDDVLKLSEMMFSSNIILTTLLSQKYPYILIDEYQDTAPEVIYALIENLYIKHSNEIVLGFFGDSHQKIYNTGIGSLNLYYNNSDATKNILKEVKKEENYRSSKNIVSVLNQFRTNIKQIPISTTEGSAIVVLCNNPPIQEEGEEKKIYNDRLDALKNNNYETVVNRLKEKKWLFNDNCNTKVLMVTNSRVAKRANFGELYSVFSKRYGLRTKDQLLDRNNPVISLFTGFTDKKTSQEREIGIEHLCDFWATKKYNEVLGYLKYHTSYFESSLISHRNKVEVSNLLKDLSDIRQNGTVEDVYIYSTTKLKIRIPSPLKIFLDKIDSSRKLEFNESDIKNYDFWNQLKNMQYKEIINFFHHKRDNTIFSTKHGTKGDEYQNVLTIIDDTEWKAEYNFNNFFNDTDENIERKQRTRNLFYVECSRAKENLVVLVLSKLDVQAELKLKIWFGEGNVVNVDHL